MGQVSGSDTGQPWLCCGPTHTLGDLRTGPVTPDGHPRLFSRRHPISLCRFLASAVTALLFKMEEANLASRAKAQELIQATNQVSFPGGHASLAGSRNSQQAAEQGLSSRRLAIEAAGSLLSQLIFLHSLPADPQSQEATLRPGDTRACTHLSGPPPWSLQLLAPWQPSPGGLWLHPSYPHGAGHSI